MAQLIDPSKVRMVGAEVIIFISYYWEIHEDGKRSQWGLDSMNVKLLIDCSPKDLEEKIAEEKGFDKVVVLHVLPMGMTGGVPLVGRVM